MLHQRILNFQWSKLELLKEKICFIFLYLKLKYKLLIKYINIYENRQCIFDFYPEHYKLQYVSHQWRCVKTQCNCSLNIN